ncbi:MAG: UvrD-helicase domain-containing protein [Elusimicrobiota bacterium]|jgi:uncharacterized protein (TIGR00375 family)|nr:UvrD-helicase domain-containing protein [Elusimicrobiota bacterium]
MIDYKDMHKKDKKLKFIADFHIHSHYSLATSKNLIPEYLEYWAKLKGVDVIATGDCIHPAWLNELKEKLMPNENGLLSLKNEKNIKNINPQIFLPTHFSNKDINFILTTEISNIYKKKGKVRKIHNLCIFPNFEAVEKFQKKLEKIGNIKSDGRPILGLDSKILLEILVEIDEKAFLIPAHIWTPWFSVLGSRSGFDNIFECYEDLTKHIFAVETGLSSDPQMNWFCSFLDDFRLVSNSDAHSPEKIGREANIFDCEKSYSGIYNALKNDDGFLGTIEFFPQEGKYHLDGHAKCNVCFSPLETIIHDGLCPVCNKPLVKGVLYRVYELADRTNINECKVRKKFYSITSLPDLVAEIKDTKSTSKIIQKEYFNILENIGSEFDTLLFSDIKKINKYNYILAESINRMRQGLVHIKGGFDGEFGKISVFRKDEIENLQHISLFSDDREKNENVRQKQKNVQKIDADLKKFKEKLSQKISKEKKEVLDTNFYKYLDLSDLQKTIIDQKDGIELVIAGPGTGKTYILTEKITMLIRDNVKQNNILAITFSNKACDEIKNRLSKKTMIFDINIMTFHKLGLKILKENISILNRNKNFFIIDETEKLEILSKLLNEKQNISKNIKNISIGKISKNISFYKQGINVNESLKNFSKVDLFNIFEKYQNFLEQKNCFDLDDLIYLAVKILSENEKIKKYYVKQFQYILIDEYQDINAKQYELIKNLLPKHNINLFVIGDPDQSIYGFRGSNSKFIKNLEIDFENVKKMRLQKSYRCSNDILKLAGQVLHKKDFLQGNKNLEITSEIIECPNEKKEAEFIAKKIDEMMGGTKALSFQKNLFEYDIKSFSDFAILCRTTKIYDEIIKQLEFNSIPYQVIGNENFYKRPPYKNFINIFKDVYFYLDYENKILEKNETFDKNIISKMVKNNENIDKILIKIIENYENLNVFDNKVKKNIKKLLEIAEKYKNNYTDFFNDISLNIGADDIDIKQEAVFLMTIHAAKGLEFDTVFIPACEEGIMPFELFGKKTKEELAEEERLLFVAITRTKKYLFMSFTKQRFFENRLLKLEKSSILDRLEEKLLKKSKIIEKINNQIEFSFL